MGVYGQETAVYYAKTGGNEISDTETEIKPPKSGNSWGFVCVQHICRVTQQLLLQVYYIAISVNCKNGFVICVFPFVNYKFANIPKARKLKNPKPLSFPAFLQDNFCMYDYWLQADK